MSGATTKYGLPYPTSGDSVVVHADVQALAVKTDAEIAAAVTPGRIAGGVSLNTITTEKTYTTAGPGSGGWEANNYPAPAPGTLVVASIASSGGIPTIQQTFIDDWNGVIYVRRREAGTWRAWQPIGPAKPLQPTVLGAQDLDALATTNAWYSSGPGAGWESLHYPAQVPGRLDVTVMGPTVLQEYTASAAKYTRTHTGTTWTSWTVIGASATTGGGQSPTASKLVAVPITAGDTTANAPQSGTVRLPLPLNVEVSRWRLRLRNVSIRSGTAKTAPVTVTGVWAGVHAGSGAAASLTQVSPALTVAGNADVATPWTTVATPAPDSELVISVGYSASGATDVASNIGTGYITGDPDDAATPAPAGLTFSQLLPFSMVLDVEVGPLTPVLATMGDSNSVGYGIKAMTESWTWRLAARLGAVPVALGSAGDTAAACTDPTAYKWTRGTPAGWAHPDAIILALGQNDLAGGATAAAVKGSIQSVAAASASIAPARHHVTLLPRNTWPMGHSAELARREVNSWLPTAGLVLDVHDVIPAVSADDESFDAGMTTDGIHMTKVGAQAVADSITRPVLPAPASGVTVTDHGTYLTLTIGD